MKNAAMIAYAGAASGVLVLGLAYAIKTGREISGLRAKAHALAIEGERKKESIKKGKR